MYVCVRPRVSSLLKLGWLLSADFSRRADDAVPTALRWWICFLGGCPAGRFYSFYFDKNRIATSCWVHEERWRRWMFPWMIARVRVAGETSTMSDVRVKKKHIKYLDLFFDLLAWRWPTCFLFSILPLLFLASFDSSFSSFGADSLIWKFSLVFL